MKKTSSAILIFFLFLSILQPCAFAENTAKHGKMTGKTAIAGACSLILWPGIGQYLNDCETKKNITHAVLGLTGIFRFWSCWDALIDRQGGRWDGKI